VVLIDTPGFDDTYKSDAEVLEMIATFLAETYSQDMLLTGIILLQPISGNRVQGNERKRTRLFEKVCGPGAFSKVIIATTMWDDLKNESQGTSVFKSGAPRTTFGERRSDMERRLRAMTTIPHQHEKSLACS
jgi:hypothetical protein